MQEPHGKRKHSKFSASGAERWVNCPGSVTLSEGMPDKESVWSKEGTQAHEVLEKILKAFLREDRPPYGMKQDPMFHYGRAAANFILGIHAENPKSEVMVETRIDLPFIHPEMFGTFDGAVLDHFGTLHVFDYKYGAGHVVSPVDNLQMIFYGLGLAARYDWNFKSAKLWIIQPRIKNYRGPIFWEMGIQKLKGYIGYFAEAVYRVEKFPTLFKEGSHCHWCKAKSICPLKTEAKTEKARLAFLNTPV